jgi:CubicO group peptidase (beta-lactamase class C family)
MQLVEQGKVDLNERVRKYVPELKLKDEETARNVTVMHLLNHTAGWQGDTHEAEAGEGDDALEKSVEKMAEIEQVTPLGTAVSYNNASLRLAGRIIEKVTGKTFEDAIKEMIFEPLGLEHCYFFPTDIMTRRFAVGHTQHPDGSITVARPWALPRSGAPSGGISSNAEDQIKWARFHLGDGRGVDGSQVLSRKSLDLMKRPTVETPGSAVGDHIGITWLMEDIDGVRLVGHGGTTHGQHSDFTLVPERDFAVAVLTNCGPNGAHLHDAIRRWALEAYIGVVERDPEPVSLTPEELAPYAGTYDTIAAQLNITPENGGLLAKIALKPEYVAKMREAGEDEPDDEPPLPIGLLPGEGDHYIITGGRGRGMKGYFVRNDSGAVEGIHIGGRLATRVHN